jgi:trans-2-enoyl-CoA reductase
MRLTFHQAGLPSDVLKLEPYDPPAPQRHEVLVRMLYAPINPADLNFIEGTYGKKASFPAHPGNEGCGRIEAVGDEVESLEVGDLVIPLHPIGTWSRYLLAAENQFAKLPTDLDPVQASMLRVNPTTAWQMIHEFRELRKGEVVAQNAANSGVGRAVIQIAKHLGLRTVNFVRREDVFEELTAMGADSVLIDGGSDEAAARTALGDQPLRLALNAVGGDSALRLMDLLSTGGAHVTYGAMSRRSLKIPNKFLIFKNLEVRGYWLTRWIEQASHIEIGNVLRPLAEMMQEGALKLPVEKVFPIEDFAEAVRLAAQDGRSGKVVLAL